MATDSGYSNQKKLGIAQFETIHPMGSNSFGKSTLSKSVYDIQITMAIASVEEELGIDGQVRLWILEIGGHSAVVGNLLKFDPASSLPNFYFEVMEVRNFDKIAVLPIAEALPQVGDTVDILGFVTSKLSALGETSVSITTPPTSFEYDGAPQTVIQSTSDETLNRALPNLNFIIKDGNQVPVTKDTATPSNTVGMPVEIVAASGTPINITAGDLNVQLSDQGVNADVVRIGDGTTQLAIKPVTGEALVHDEDAAVFLSNMDGYLANLQQTVSTDGGVIPPSAILMGGKNGTDFLGLSMSPTGEANVVVTGAALPTGAATEAKQDTLIAKDFATSAKQDTLIAKDFATQATLAALLVELALKADLTETQPVSAASLPLPTGAATSAKQDLLLAELQLKADLSETQPVSIAAAIPSTVNAGTITSAQIVVGLTAVRATVAGTAPNAARKKLMIKPSKNNTGAIYLGASGVTTGNGMEVIGPDRLEFEFDSGDYYLISDTAAQVVEIIEKV